MDGEQTICPGEPEDFNIAQTHDTKAVGHLGFMKTLHLVKRQFWWPGMKT